MQRYVAFLRGMNIAGRRIKNDELRAELEALGFEDVACFRASGNVIFDSVGGERKAALTSTIEAGLGEALGYEVPVFLRSRAETIAISAQAPFDPKLVAASKGQVQILLLPKEPAAAARKRALALSDDRDRLAIEGSELFWLPSGGISESDLDLKTIYTTLGDGTMRTKGTIDQIAAKLDT